MDTDILLKKFSLESDLSVERLRQDEIAALPKAYATMAAKRLRLVLVGNVFVFFFLVLFAERFGFFPSFITALIIVVLARFGFTAWCQAYAANQRAEMIFDEIRVWAIRHEQVARRRRNLLVVAFVTLLALGVTLVATAPNETDLRSLVLSEAHNEGGAFGAAITEAVLEVHAKNFVVFSLGGARIMDNQPHIYLGVLGHWFDLGTSKTSNSKTTL